MSVRSVKDGKDDKDNSVVVHNHVITVIPEADETGYSMAGISTIDRLDVNYS